MSDSDQFNHDELVPPSFLTAQYFQDVLKTVENDPDLKVHPLFPINSEFITQKLLQGLTFGQFSWRF